MQTSIQTLQKQNQVFQHIPVKKVSDFSLPVKRSWLSPDQFGHSHERKRAWLKAIREEFSPGASRMETLECLCFLTDPVDGIGSPSVGTILGNRQNPISYRTLLRHLSWFIERKILLKDGGNRKNVSKHKTPPKQYTLVGYKYKLEDYYDTMSISLKPSKKDKRGGFKKGGVDKINASHYRERGGGMDTELEEHEREEIEKTANRADATPEERQELVKKYIKVKETRGVKSPSGLAIWILKKIRENKLKDSDGSQRAERHLLETQRIINKVSEGGTKPPAAFLALLKKH